MGGFEDEEQVEEVGGGWVMKRIRPFVVVSVVVMVVILVVEYVVFTEIKHE